MATHTATPHGSAANPQEDIGAVLERFEQWSGKQRRPSSAPRDEKRGSGSQRTAHLAYSASHQMTRELSYEEALSRARTRSRRSWSDDTEAAPPTTASATDAPAAKAEQTPKASERSPKTSPATHAPKTAAKANPAAKKSAQTGTRHSRSSAQAPEPGDGRKTKAVRDTKARNKKNSSPSKDADPKPRAKTVAAAEKVPAAVANTPAPQPEPTFQQALSAQIYGAGALVPEVFAEPAPLHAEEISGSSVSVTVHLSVTERNALRLRAQQLGLTADAYLRQCALEVESLRSELQERLVSRMQAARQLPAQPRRDWLGRLKQYFFPQRTDCQTQIFHA